MVLISTCPAMVFFPFCQINWARGCNYIAERCVGCGYAVETGLATHNSSSANKPWPCNADVTYYPLELANCSWCNKTWLNLCLCFLMLVCVITVALNLWSVTVWLRIRPKRCQTYIKLSLTISDLLFGVIVLPEAIYRMIDTMYIGHEEFYQFGKLLSKDQETFSQEWDKKLSPSFIQFSSCVLYVTQGASLCSLLLLSVDRHLAITKNIKYPIIMTKKRCLLAIALMWTIVTCLGLGTTLGFGKYVKFRITPSVMFLPKPEPLDANLYANMILGFLTPLLLVFLLNVIVTLKTSFALHQRISSQPPRLSERTLSSFASSWVDDASQAKSSCSKPGDEGNDVFVAEKHCESSLQTATVEKEEMETSRKDEAVNTAKNQVRLSLPLVSYKKFKNSRFFNRSSVQNLEAQSQANKTLLLILLVYLMCALPFTVLMTYSLFEPEIDGLADKNGMSLLEKRYIGNLFTVGIFLTSSMWNCIIYSLRNREYRRSSKRLLSKLLRLN